MRPSLVSSCARAATAIGRTSRSAPSHRLAGRVLPQHFCAVRPMMSSPPNNPEDERDELNPGRSSPTIPDDDASVLLYKAPMGDLITRLKRISITSCLVSVVGLPALVLLKNGGTWPPDLAKQIGLGGFAFVTAGGSTMALHFVFGPYVLELHRILGEATPEDGDSDHDDEATKRMMMKATTRTILGTTQEVVFDPLTDVTHYAGGRPFANFIAKDIVLYCHPELLDDTTKSLLLSAATLQKEQEKKDAAQKKPRDDDDDIL